VMVGGAGGGAGCGYEWVLGVCVWVDVGGGGGW